MDRKAEYEKIHTAQMKQMRILENIINSLKDKERTDEEDWIYSTADRALIELKWALW